MTKKQFEVRTYYECPVCECGGLIRNPSGTTAYLTNPIQMDFYCEKCGKVIRLFEKDFPGIREEVVGLEV